MLPQLGHFDSVGTSSRIDAFRLPPRLVECRLFGKGAIYN